MGSPDYEMDHILDTTGRLPAMRGLGFMNNDFSGVVKRSKEWHDKGGIVTICWHTGVKSSGYRESLDDTPDFDKLLTKGTDEYNTTARHGPSSRRSERISLWLSMNAEMFRE